MAIIIDFQKHKEARDKKKQAEVDLNIELLLSAPSLSDSDMESILKLIEDDQKC